MDLSSFEFDWSQDPKTLREVYKQTNFDETFYRMISRNVIETLSPQSVTDPHNLIYDDETIQKHLIGQLERFICNFDENVPQDKVDKVFEHIKTLKQPSKLCRKVLKTGDVLFSCNDCGFDATCVVCIDCFHKSAHKDHNYRMSNTDGGGCCDCGDVEAWKQHPACSDHMAPDQPSLSLSDFEDKELRCKQIQSDKTGILDKISLLTNGVAERYFLVCQASLHYARLMLTWDKYDSLPSYLEIDGDDPKLAPLLSRDSYTKNFFTVLFNDEVHTYDHVINTLVKIIKCTKMTASIMASTVSREGRSLILNDVYKECRNVRDAIAHVRDSGQGPLKVEVIHGTVLAHQAFALKLIEWIQRMSLLCDAFRVLTAYTLLGTYDSIPEQEKPSGSETLLERIMLSNTTFWKVARIDWNDLFVTTLLTEYSIKEKFARLITRIYPRLMQDFMEDDHDHSVSILTMTTQLYTVPSLICMLIEEENALSIISRTFIDICRSTKRESSAITFENRHTFDPNSLKRGFYIISDLRHLINIEPTKWTTQLRANVIEAVKVFLNLLDLMQGLDSVKRQLGQHLEYEPEWETGMTLQSRLISFITRLVTYCSLDEQVLIEVLRETQVRLFKNGSFKTVTKELFGHQVSCIQYDVSTSLVSVHLPLTRFAAALIIELMQRRPCDRIPYDESLVILTDQSENKHSMIDIMEPSLRTEVMIAQFRSGMWRRNGYSLVNQILYFSGALLRKEMFDRDILVLQECAATCEANEFLIHLLNKFNLFTWVSSETTREPLVGPKAVSFYNDEEIMTQTMSLGEEFLQLLLIIVGERYRVGIGKIQPEDVIKNEIIQLLCIGPFTRSDLTQKLYVSDNELDCIKAVANLRRSTESSTGKYELKDEFYDRFNPFFYHYNRRYQSHALDAQLKRKRNLKESLICCPPPAPVELTDQFRNLNELLKCSVTLIIIQKILRRALGPPENSQECSTKAPIRFLASDLQLDQCLHLIGLGLYEQERDPLVFKYLEAAHENDIFNLLKECYEKAKRSKDLIFWIMKKTNNLIEILETNELSEYQSRVYSSIRSKFSSILSTCDTVKQENRKRNSELAAQRRERIMAQMKAKQNEFLSNPSTQQLIAETDQTGSSKSNLTTTTATPITPIAATTSPSSHLDLSVGQSSAADARGAYVTRSGRKIKQPKSTATESATETPMDCKSDTDDDDDEPMDSESITIPGEESSPIDENHLCILCRDEQKIGFDKPTMVLLAYIQRSAVLSKNRGERRIPNYALTPSNQLKHLFLSQPNSKPGSSPELYSFTSDNSWSFDATFMPADLFFGPYVSTCGHVMHYECWQGFFDAVVKRETSRPNRGTRHASFELEKNEILCPLCECISNATIPLLPDHTRFIKRQLKAVDTLDGTIFGSSLSTINKSSDNLSACLHALRGTVDMFKHIRHIKDVSTSALGEDKYMRLLQPKPINDVLEELDEAEALMLRDFITTVRSNSISSPACTKSLLSSISTLADRIHSVGLDLDKSISDVHHARIFMMTSWTISYTIQAHERAARFKGSPIFEDLESSKNLCLSSLLRFATGSMMTHQSDMMQSLLVRKLRYLLINDEHLGSSPCCLDVDAFEMFVSVFILLQKLYSHIDDSSSLLNRESVNETLSSSFKSTSSKGSSKDDYQNYSWTTCAYDHEYFRNLLHLMLILNLLQVTITMQNEITSDSDDDATGDNSRSTNECLILHNFYKDIILASGHPNAKLPPMNVQLVNRIRCRLLPFLRSCSIFFYHLSHIMPSETLRTRSAFFEGKDFPNANQTGEFDLVDFAKTNEEFESICRYLDLPSDFSVLLKSNEAKHLARAWLRHSRVLLLIKSAIDAAANEAPNTKRQQKPIQVSLKRTAGLSSGSTSKSTSAKAEVSLSSPGGSGQPDSELMPVELIRQPHLVNRLIDLPYDYSELVDKVSDFTCPSIRNEDSRTPTMCLVCGVMLCSQSYCCQRDLNDLASNYQEILQRQEEARQQLVAAANAAATAGSGGQQSGAGSGGSSGAHFLGSVGAGLAPNTVAALSLGSAAALLFSSASGTTAVSVRRHDDRSVANVFNTYIHQQLVGSCTYHAHECSGGVGIFLRIRNCQILLLSGRSKGCYMPAPYIDDHGETDFGLMRGNPLHLNREHYERLQHMWMNHSIPEQISRTLEYSSYASNINWHLH